MTLTVMRNLFEKFMLADTVIRCLSGITSGCNVNAIYRAQTEMMQILVDNGYQPQMPMPRVLEFVTPEEVGYDVLIPLVRNRATYLSSCVDTFIANVDRFKARPVV